MKLVLGDVCCLAVDCDEERDRVVARLAVATVGGKRSWTGTA
jgi:hypothetical protein